MGTRLRTMSYLRATWESDPGFTIQDALARSLEGRLSADTMIPLREGHAAICGRQTTPDGIFIHVAAWTDRQHVATIPHLDGRTDVSLELNPPGDNWEYLAGDGHLFVWKNHCVMMPSRLHPRSLQRYLYEFLAPHHPSVRDCQLLPIANPEKVRQVRRQGVKHIDLHIGQYRETALSDSFQRRKPISQLGRDLISSLFQEDLLDPFALEAASNLNIKLVVSLDTRKRLGLQPEDLVPLAERISDDGDDDLVDLVTASGYRIRRGDLVLRKSVKVESHGSTVKRRHAWILMQEYFTDLRRQGLLEQ